MTLRTVSLAASIAALWGCAEPGHDPRAAPHSHSPSLHDSSAARTIDFPGHRMRVLLDAHALDGDIAVFEITVPPRTLAGPPHVHRDGLR